MATVISSEKISKHAVDKYTFKVLAFGSNSDDKKKCEQGTGDKTDSLNEAQTTPQESSVDSSAMSQNSKDSLIESLLKKTDEMSSNFIKLQMKLEAKELEYQEALKKAKEEAYQEGVEAGKKEALKMSEKNYEKAIEQFASSVTTLEKSAQEYEKALEGIKDELITAALDISKEVVNVELSVASQEIAKVLSVELIKELQSASKITLKVNPKDHGAVSEKVGKLKHIEVVSDSAVSEGGVVAISDAGNIDAQISKRFERVKRAALSE